MIELLRDHGLTNIASGVVTSEQSGIAKANSMLSRLKTKEEWLSSITDKQLKLVKTVFGNPSAFYDKFRNELISLSQSAEYV